MIIRSIGKKLHNYEQAIIYVLWEKQKDHILWYTYKKDRRQNKPIIYFKDLLIDPLNPTKDSITNSFHQIIKNLPKRKNWNYIYHDIISLKWIDQSIPRDKQEQILLDLVQKYLPKRTQWLPYYWVLHTNTKHPHFHILIPACNYWDKHRTYLKDYEFNKLREQLELYRLKQYPELNISRLYTKHLEKAKEKENIITTSKPKTSNNEYQLKKRTGRRTRNERVRDKLKSILDKSTSDKELLELMNNNKLKFYCRVRTFWKSHKQEIETQTWFNLYTNLDSIWITNLKDQKRQYLLTTLWLQEEFVKTLQRFKEIERSKLELDRFTKQNREIEFDRERKGGREFEG